MNDCRIYVIIENIRGVHMDIIIIPAFNPDDTLLALIDEISKTNFRVIIVDDGSHQNSVKIFAQIEGKNCVILHHHKNLGKGQAIKTALRYIKERNIICDSICIMDCDGQHLLSDVQKILFKSKENRNSLILGSRNIEEMPFRSRLGNLMTRKIFALTSKKKLTDTQTGLRCFDAILLDTMIGIKGDRYEYETNMLLELARLNIPIIEVEIHTIYHDKRNSVSHFRVVKDSVRIYKDLLKFSFVSFSRFILDYIVFGILVSILKEKVIVANIFARCMSAIYNYELNCKFVFQKKQSIKSIAKYVVLVILVLCMNNVLLCTYMNLFDLPIMYIKVLVEITLFFINFLVQKIYVFKKN